MNKINQYSFPWLTSILSVISIAIFILFQIYQQDNTPLFKSYSELGAPYAIQIYHGQYWGVFTNSFFHLNYIHLAINLSGLWILGAYLERRLSIFKFFLLGLIASIITSCIQLALTNDAGIGLSGVNLFFLGFILGKSIKSKEFELRNRYLLLLITIIGLSVALYLNLYHNFLLSLEAMTSGLIIGFIFGLLSIFKSNLPIIIFGKSIISLSIITLFYSPWSAEWNYSKGYTAHEIGNNSEAKKYYTKAIEINPQHSVSKENLRLIEIDELSDKAFDAHENEKYLEAKKHYEDLLKIDPENNWAKENISKLP